MGPVKAYLPFISSVSDMYGSTSPDPAGNGSSIDSFVSGHNYVLKVTLKNVVRNDATIDNDAYFYVGVMSKSNITLGSKSVKLTELVNGYEFEINFQGGNVEAIVFGSYDIIEGDKIAPTLMWSFDFEINVEEVK